MSNVKGKCVVCKKNIDLPILSDMIIVVSVEIPIICKDCRGDDIIPPRIVVKSNRRRRSDIEGD